MTMLFRADDLLVTEEQIRSGAGTYQISDVRSVWVTHGLFARHELWISTASGRVRLWRHNSIEANKAMRAIRRARERHRERNEV